MLTAPIPRDLREALDRLAARHRAADLIRAAEALSAQYRRGATPRLRSEIDAAAYALTRMPATFAAVVCALREWPSPVETVLDLGSGTGATAWAARTAFDERARTTLVERDPAMRALGESLQPAGAEWRSGDLRNLSGLSPHDLVVFSYSLGELAPGVARDVLVSAWSLTRQALLIVEPGTPAAAACVLRLRTVLTDLGATVAAPCPHSGPCPLASPDWCHFAVRLERSHVHRLLKGGSLGYEDEKFSYTLAARLGAAPADPPERVLRHPHVGKGFIGLQLCTPSGLVRRRVGASSKAVFRQARKASWGSRWTETTPPED
jgi:ribosomal protein RSM22 (predicted rRNA methylase)